MRPHKCQKWSNMVEFYIWLYLYLCSLFVRVCLVFAICISYFCTKSTSYIACIEVLACVWFWREKKTLCHQEGQWTWKYWDKSVESADRAKKRCWLWYLVEYIVGKAEKYFSHLGQLDLASKKYLMKREKRGRKYTTCIPNIQGKLLWSEGQSLPSKSLRLKKLNRWRNNFWFWKKTSQSPKTFCHPHEPSMKYLIGSEDLSKPTEFSEQTLLPAFRGFLDYCIMTWREIGK